MSFLEREKRKLHYQFFCHDEPQAPLVIYLHGLLMDNLSSGYFTFAHSLSKHAHVLLFDLHGHGRSRFTSTGYRLSDHLEDIQALIHRVYEEISKQHQRVISPLNITLIGCSFGGALALKAAVHLPNITSIILLEGHLGTPKFIKQLSQDLQATGSEAEALIQHHFQHWLHRDSPRKRSRLLKKTKQLVYESSLISDLKAVNLQQQAQPSLQDNLLVLEKVSQPIYFLYGSHSDAYTQAWSYFLERKKHVTLDRFDRFDGLTHALLWEATTEVTQKIVNWVTNEGKEI